MDQPLQKPLLKSITVKKYATLKDATYELQPFDDGRKDLYLAVIVGANGSGKSNLIRALKGKRKRANVVLTYTTPREVNVKAEIKTWAIMHHLRKSHSENLNTTTGDAETKYSAFHNEFQQFAKEVFTKHTFYQRPTIHESFISVDKDYPELIHQPWFKLFQEITGHKLTNARRMDKKSPQFELTFDQKLDISKIENGSLSLFWTLYLLETRDVIILDEFDQSYHPDWTRLLLSHIATLRGKSIILISHSRDTVDWAPPHCLIAANRASTITSLKPLKKYLDSIPYNISGKLDVGRVLFAARVILVEGRSDQVFLEGLRLTLMKQSGSSLTYGSFISASIISMGSCNNLAAYLSLCRYLELPVKAICDLDVIFSEPKPSSTLLQNYSLVDILSLYPNWNLDQVLGLKKKFRNREYFKKFQDKMKSLKQLRDDGHVQKDVDTYVNLQKGSQPKGIKNFGVEFDAKKFSDVRAAVLEQGIWEWKTDNCKVKIQQFVDHVASKGLFLWRDGAIECVIYELFKENWIELLKTDAEKQKHNGDLKLHSSLWPSFVKADVQHVYERALSLNQLSETWNLKKTASNLTAQEDFPLRKQLISVSDQLIADAKQLKSTVDNITPSGDNVIQKLKDDLVKILRYLFDNILSIAKLNHSSAQESRKLNSSNAMHTLNSIYESLSCTMRRIEEIEASNSTSATSTISDIVTNVTSMVCKEKPPTTPMLKSLLDFLHDEKNWLFQSLDTEFKLSATPKTFEHGIKTMGDLEAQNRCCVLNLSDNISKKLSKTLQQCDGFVVCKFSGSVNMDDVKQHLDKRDYFICVDHQYFLRKQEENPELSCATRFLKIAKEAREKEVKLESRNDHLMWKNLDTVVNSLKLMNFSSL